VVASGGEPAGMAWLAVLDRVPRPGSARRRCGDVQSVFVLPGHRFQGLGTALVRAVLTAADELELAYVTVNAAPESASLYERNGFVRSGTLLLHER
jgi:GNAT superfamily N-acetyltransferase